MLLARKTYPITQMPKKIRELISQLENAGFVNRGGKGSHRNFVHPNIMRSIVISGKTGDDAKKYQERAVEAAIEESKK
jgi:predicted RNA binding protein YcfA (HicA-like mRNA interferase family)